MNLDSDPALPRSSRKHSRTSDLEDYVSDWSSDVSGRFDDAAEEPGLEEYQSCEAKPAKRRRSNDWPLPEEAADYGHPDRRVARNAYITDGAGAGAGPGYRGSPRASPRTSLASLRGRTAATLTDSPRARLGRRSRFVEANMSDSISEEPPTVFVQDAKPPGPRHRPSGIFRFGKAIASAFNPFGGWGRPSPPPPKDTLTQAEEAYAELKKAGYKGTNKGSYMQSQTVASATARGAVDPHHADQTWHTLQSKFNSGAEGSSTMNSQASDRGEYHGHSRSTSKSSKRSSFQDLRSIGIPFVRYHDPSSATSVYQERTSEESIDNTTGLRKQRSRKEISRQTKLLKKVSNLEDKLERARRELRQLSGNEERLPSTDVDQKPSNLDMDPASYPRKFVPGALPTLPSERLLDQHAADVDRPGSCTSEITALPTVEERENFSPGPSTGGFSRPVSRSPSKQHGETRQPSMSKTTSSRKRKSDPEHLDSRHPKPLEPPTPQRLNSKAADHDHDRGPSLITELINDKTHNLDTLSPPRPAKWQKQEAGDSPGSASRKRDVDRDKTLDAAHEKSPHPKARGSSPAASRSPQSQSVLSPASSKAGLPRSRSQSNLRFTSPATASPTKTIPESPAGTGGGVGGPGDDVFSSSPAFLEMPHAFYLQSHCQLDPDRKPLPSPTKPQTTRKRSRHDSSDIPPVPPLPQELLMNNHVQIHRSPIKRMNSTDQPVDRAGDAGAEDVDEDEIASVQSPRPSFLENYPWPETIF
ncbi:Uncharacterized protein PECH_001972 [Penicillium ucsense]|uniref:Nuclear RNA binding protein n=1 Tax=Penicillium ucsense TaxID=2839758 RepID=A0A8J8VYD8_9EURO|nr:Uncharacterized protein PECM_008838 [Penicillium ucsense]KAF7731371.1 Uncharacterized protein PECH_001972 [Penicillium ucsense]